MLLSFIFISLLLQSLFALPLTSTPYYIRSAYMGNCIVSTHRGVHAGASVVTTPLVAGGCPGNTVVNIKPHSDGYQISGHAGLFIRPSKSDRKLVWDKKPFAWHFLDAGFGYYLVKGHNRVWLDDPRNPKIVDLVKGKSTQSVEYYWILDIA